MNLPNTSNRYVGVGATGSGKTHAALWVLSMMPIDRMPFVVVNYKGDESIDAIPFKQDIGLDEVPVKPGVYVTHPHVSQGAAVERQLWEIWARGDTGVYTDEGLMMGRYNEAFRALLTQGRSRKIPMITLSQRPKWLDPFVLSEAEFYQVFRLNNKKDVMSVAEFIPETSGDISKRLPEYHSYYYDVKANNLSVVKPVPSIEKIHAHFARLLKPVRKVI